MKTRATRVSSLSRSGNELLWLGIPVFRTVDLDSCRSFDELHAKINETIGDIHMIGALVAFDVAQRIGAFLKLDPERVYFHRGTRDAAVALEFDRDRETIELVELPGAFQNLSAAEAEDCLCIYMERLRGW